MDDIKTLVTDMYGQGKATLNWTTALDKLDKNCARILLNLVMLTVQAVPRGGDINITISENGESTQLKLDATGPKSRLDSTIDTSLSGKRPEDGFDGRTILPFYTGLLIRELKGSVVTSVEEETVLSLIHISEPTRPY